MAGFRLFSVDAYLTHGLLCSNYYIRISIPKDLAAKCLYREFGDHCARPENRLLLKHTAIPSR